MSSCRATNANVAAQMSEGEAATFVRNVAERLTGFGVDAGIAIPHTGTL